MTIAVVYAHPLPGSFASAVLGAVTAGLADGGQAAEVVDLYADGYRPGAELPEIHRTVLMRSDAIVLVHPTWWTSQPAILLAWMQTASREQWATITSVVEVATHGGGRLGNVVAGRAGRCSGVRFAELVSAGGAHYWWRPLYGIDRSTAAQRTEHLTVVRCAMAEFAGTGSPGPGRTRRPFRSLRRFRFQIPTRGRTRPWSSSS